MARSPRADVFDPLKVSVFHCINRCVRRCFLCGDDPHSGKNFDHRKQWLEDRLAFLAQCFGIDILGFAILSNHFHVILRNRPDVVAAWSDEEVARRWLRLCPVRKDQQGQPAEPSPAEIQAIVDNAERLREIRLRLSHISWFMRMVAEPMARRANAEDDCAGRFWQGRFKAVKLCDAAALVACSVYVDLNIIRAGLAESPETSHFTSAKRRIQSAQVQAEFTAGRRPQNPAELPDRWLAPLSLDDPGSVVGPALHRDGWRCSDKGFLSMSLSEYLTLLDWTGRQVKHGKAGHIPEHIEPILVRLGINQDGWLELASNFGRLFYRVAGRRSAVACQRTRRGGHFRPGHWQLFGRD